MTMFKMTLTAKLQQIVPYNAKRVVLLIQNTSDTNNVYLTDRPKEDSETPFLILAPKDVITFMKVFGDDPRYALYGKADADTVIVVIEYFEGD